MVDDKQKLGIVVVVLVIAVLLGNYFGLFSVFGQPSVGYKNVNFDGNNLIYSGPNGPDNNYFEANHNFMQWTGGNVQGFQFYQNQPFLQFYLKANNINLNDFTLLAGDGDCMPIGRMLKPAYCMEPPSGAILKSLDSNGCEIYDVQARTQSCCCLGDGSRLCGSDLSGWSVPDTGICIPPGASGSSWNACHTYATVASDVGGTKDGQPRNYLSLFNSFGWTSGYETSAISRCPNNYLYWMTPISDLGLTTIKNNYICEATGTLNDGTTYDLLGTIDWESTTTGLVCKTSGGDPNKKISDGTVTFRLPITKTFYRFANNQCTQLSLLETAKTSDDYLLQTDCARNIVTSVDCTESDWTSVISPSTCPSNSQQTKTWTKVGTCTNGVNHPASEMIACNYNQPQVNCTSFTYSNWNNCTSSGTQTRNLISSLPSGCSGGSPVLSQSCTYQNVTTNVTTTNTTTSTTTENSLQDFWNKYYIIIIALGSLFLVILLFGGKK